MTGICTPVPTGGGIEPPINKQQDTGGIGEGEKPAFSPAGTHNTDFTQATHTHTHTHILVNTSAAQPRWGEWSVRLSLTPPPQHPHLPGASVAATAQTQVHGGLETTGWSFRSGRLLVCACAYVYVCSASLCGTKHRSTRVGGRAAGSWFWLSGRLLATEGARDFRQRRVQGWGAESQYPPPQQGGGADMGWWNTGRWHRAEEAWWHGRK